MTWGKEKWACENCGATGEAFGTPDKCPECGSTDTTPDVESVEKPK